MKHQDKWFIIADNEITDAHTCNLCNDSILGSNLVSQAILESSSIDCNMCMIAENVSSLGNDADNTDNFAHFAFCLVELGLDSCVTSHVVNDLKLFISEMIAEL